MPNFTELTLCGYQGWFAVGEDNTLGRWSHWSKRGAPGPGNTTFELYPDVNDYPPAALKPAGYDELGNGDAAELFGSERVGVIELHFRWMRQHGIDGVALQRFVDPMKNEANRAWRNHVAESVREQAEATERSFYVMYDITGANWPRGDYPSLKAELREDVAKHIHPLAESAAWARQDDRPVIAVWGLGFTDRHVSMDDALNTIAMLRDEFGYYIALGVPYRWREGIGDALPGWLSVYEKADMLIPWSVGRYRTIEELDGHIRGIWTEDKEFCDQRGIVLQRVIFPGFAWSNLKAEQLTGTAHARSHHAVSQTEAAQRNAIPRNQGDFLWAQAYRVARYGTGAFIAMFDEYDEATAIAPAATDASMIPKDEYFLTLDADGVKLPSDHYLWLAGKLSKMIREPSTASKDRPTPAVEPPAEKPKPAPRWSSEEAELVVKHAYLGLFGRPADPGGLDHFAERLQEGDATVLICRILADSPEYERRNADSSAEKIAKRLYTDLLTRPSDQIDEKGLQATVEAIQSGDIAARTADILEGDEFRKRVLDGTR